MARTLLLTERDHALLVSLLKYRYLSSRQVERLHFSSHQTATRRLRLLAQAGYVTTFRAHGIEEHLAALTEQGAQVVAEELLVPLQQLGWTPRREEPKDYLFLKHFLLCGDVRISLTQGCTLRDSVALLGFIPEHLGDKTPNGGVQKYVRDVVSDIAKPQEKLVHTPDGVFALAREERAALFFLEIDRGTETLADAEHGFLKALRFYLNYLVTGGYQRYSEDFRILEPFKAFRVLVLTSSERRLQNIRTLCGRLHFEPASAKRFIWLQTLEVAQANDFLRVRWHSLDPSDETLYTILPHPASAEGEIHHVRDAQRRDDSEPMVVARG